MHMYGRIGKSKVYVIFDCINWRDTLLLGTHNFVGTSPRAARRRINIPTLQSYRLWSLLSAHHSTIIIQKTYLQTALEAKHYCLCLELFLSLFNSCHWVLLSSLSS